MAADLQTMLREAMLNNSYDHSSTHLANQMTWENSFSYLYGMQVEKIAYDAYHYYSCDDISMDVTTIGHLYFDDDFRVRFDIDKDIVDVCGREDYRTSKYYHMYVSRDEMLADPEMFHWIPIVIIDNHVLWDWEMKVINKDAMQFRLPSTFKIQYVIENTRNPVTDRYIYIEHKMEVLVVENLYWERFSVNRTNLNLSSDGSFKLAMSMMSDNPLKDDSREGIFFVSFNTVVSDEPEENNYEYLLGTQMMDLYVEDGYLTGKFTNMDVYNEYASYSGIIWINLIYINKLHRKTLYTGRDYLTATKVRGEDRVETEYMVINRNGDFVPYASPIPICNFMLFKHRDVTEEDSASEDSDEPDIDWTYDTLLHTDTGIKMWYPNVYTVSDPHMEEGDTYKVFYFYDYNIALKYTYLFEFWYRYLYLHFNFKDGLEMSLEEIFNRILAGTMDYDVWTTQQMADFEARFKDLMEYMTIPYKYNEVDYIQNYLELDVPQDMQYQGLQHYHYKEQKLKEWIKEDPWLLKDYVLEQKKMGTNYYLYTSMIDLPSRIRTNTSLELDYDYELEEECYVFSISNKRTYPVLINARFFVDGLLITGFLQDRKLYMDYFYIPTRFVTDHSWIEVELANAYMYESDRLNFTSMDQVEEFTIPIPKDKDIFPTLQDPYIFNEIDTTDPYSYSHSQFSNISDNFTVTSIYDTGESDEGSFECVTTDDDKPIRFTRLHHFTIQPLTDTVINNPFYLKVSKIPWRLTYRIPEAGYAMIYLVGAEDLFNYNREYIRIWYRGRLLPDIQWYFFGFYDQPRIVIGHWMEKGDLIYIDISPFRHKLNYYQADLDPNESLIDLSDWITKPFDWRYYDVYVNGRRMAMNCYALDPYLITLTNLKSLHNLAIYEKERDWEYYGVNYKEHPYHYLLDDLFHESFVSDKEKEEMVLEFIKDHSDPRLPIEPNEDNEVIEDWTDESKYFLLWIFYYDELIPKGYHNPSVLQFNKLLITTQYPIIYDTYIKLPGCDARTETEASYQANFPEVLMLDPDILIEGEAEDGLTYVWMTGHGGNEIPPEYFEQVVEIDDETFRLGGEY